MPNKIRVSILDDHQSIIDGYIYRLSGNPKIMVAAAMSYAEELEPSLAAHPTDVLLLDISVPTAPNNPNPYPTLYIIPKLLDEYAGLSILVITMFNERGLVKSVMEAGASGYILKDDQSIIRNRFCPSPTEGLCLANRLIDSCSRVTLQKIVNS